jgi:hypothetical protein
LGPRQKGPSSRSAATRLAAVDLQRARLAADQDTRATAAAAAAAVAHRRDGDKRGRGVERRERVGRPPQLGAPPRGRGDSVALSRRRGLSFIDSNIV